MKTTSLAAAVAAFATSASAQSWDLQFGNPSQATAAYTKYGSGTIQCLAQGPRYGDLFKYTTWDQLVKREAAEASSPTCSVRRDMRHWKNEDNKCAKEKDVKKRDTCRNDLVQKKRDEIKKIEDCVRERERECSLKATPNEKKACTAKLNRDRNVTPTPPKSNDLLWGSQPPRVPVKTQPLPPYQPSPPPPPQTWPTYQKVSRCCLKYYQDAHCKNTIFETCVTGEGYAQGDVGSFNILCDTNQKSY